MDEDGAEDVIFEGSPLFEYLKETCPRDEFESSLPQSKGVQKVTTPNPSKSNQKYFELIFSGLGIVYIKNTCEKLLSWPVAQGQSHHEQNISCQVEVLSRITQSRLLNEADLFFLSSILKYMRDERQVSHYQPVSILHIFISGLLFLGSSICFFLPRITSSSLTEQPLMNAAACTEIFLGAVLLLIALNICLRGFHRGKVSRAYENLKAELDRCIRLEETFLQCFRRSLQYIQEVEVLSRGYTMVNVPSGNKETSVIQLLPLRKVCLLVVTRHLSTLRAALNEVIDGFPVPTEYTLSADSISNQEVPRWITDVALESQMLDSQPDKGMFSLSTLKILFGLYKEQCSDFYRQQVISFIYSDELSCTDGKETRELQKWLKIIMSGSSECEESTNRLTEAYKVHRWSPTPVVTDKPREVSRREVWRPEVQCTTALHSLRLHLETMLSRISPTDDELTESEVINITVDRVAELQVILTELGDHMEASQICCQEARASLGKLAGREEPLETRGDENGGEVDAVECQEPIERISITAEYSEDIQGDLDEQIFEAYIGTKKKLQEVGDSEEWLQERIQKRREAEDAKRMLQELNSVLTKRSEERERNKQQKLLKEQNKQTELPSPSVDGVGDGNNLVPPAGHEYPSCDRSDIDDSPSARLLEKIELDGGSCSGKQTECDASLNASEHKDDELEPHSRVSSRTHNISASEASLDLINSSNINESGNVSDRSDCTKQSTDGKSIDSPSNKNSSSPDRQSKNQVGGRIAAGVNEHMNLPDGSSPQFESTCASRNRYPTDKINSGEGESSIRPIATFHESGATEISSKKDTSQTEQEEISDDGPVAPHSYECDSSDRERGLAASSDLSTERSSFLAVNPWMAPGLAAQVARISLERNNLCEETFGENDSEEDY